MSEPRVRVVIADDHPLYREGVARALADSGQIEVLAEVEDGQAALAEIRSRTPDVAVLDYRLPGLDGLAVANAIVRDGLPTRVLLLSGFDDSSLVFKALQSGVSGFLPKESRRDEIRDAVLACARGENVLPPRVASGVVTEIRLRAANDRPALTERERDVLRLIAEGKSVPAIARELYLGATTVKTHVQHLYEKLGVSDRAAAVAEAMRRGLLE
jgi:two-component system nitrate/nitrite response regulator NarL